MLPMKACPLPSLVRRLEADPDPACVLTMRAPDKWESARLTDIFLASGLHCSQAESTLRPLAGNAGRSAAISARKGRKK